ncbi:MAG: hypothetical protein WCB53_15765 [Terriglobales bacterium]
MKRCHRFCGTVLPDANKNPPLKSLHADSALIRLKLAEMDRKSTGELIDSLRPGQKDCLKTRRDGTILDGHHRLYLLRQRGINVDELPRDVIEKG